MRCPYTCIHADSGLCDTCQADWDYDPDSYAEFGDHPEGLARWRALQEEMTAEAARIAALPSEVDDPSIPF